MLYFMQERTNYPQFHSGLPLFLTANQVYFTASFTASMSENKLNCFIEFAYFSGPSTPQNLSAQSISSTEIQVSWKAPVNTNGNVKYRLSFYNATEPSAAPKLVYDGNATQYLVSNLMPYTLYTFEVTAYNVKYNLSSAATDTLEKTDQAR